MSSSRHDIGYIIPPRIRSPPRLSSPPRVSSPGVPMTALQQIDLDILRRSTIRNSGYSLVQLKNFARQRDLPVYGTKLTLVQRLLAEEEVD